MADKKTEQQTVEQQGTAPASQTKYDYEKYPNVERTLQLSRGTFRGKDRSMVAKYFLKSNLRGKDIEIRFGLKEEGGNRDLLEVIFGTAKKVDLLVIPGTFENADGEIQEFCRTVAISNDEDGTFWDAVVAPSSSSDREMFKKHMANFK